MAPKEVHSAVQIAFFSVYFFMQKVQLHCVLHHMSSQLILGVKGLLGQKSGTEKFGFINWVDKR